MCTRSSVCVFVLVPICFYLNVCVHACMRVCLQMSVCTRRSVRVCVLVPICVHMHMCLHSCMCVRGRAFSSCHLCIRVIYDSLDQDIKFEFLIGFYVMAPAVSCSPRYSCLNYPLCTGSVVHGKTNGKRMRTSYCSACAASFGCIFDGMPQQTCCVQHYTDLAFGGSLT